eukprot:scaffold3855_cov199-Alexandrium_tamarense.AAC.10
MLMLSLVLIFAASTTLAASFQATALTSLQSDRHRSQPSRLVNPKLLFSTMNDPSDINIKPESPRHAHCDLPGDPSLILTTNVDLGDAKGDILKQLSALVAASTGKPETVCITDNASMVFGGSDAPLALGCVYSLGAINMANNGKIQSGVTDALESYGVSENRIYINFFDMPRECVGWNRATFAG